MVQGFRRPELLQRETATMKELTERTGLLLVIRTRANDDLSQTVRGVEPRLPKSQVSRDFPPLFERYTVWLHS